MNDYDGHMDVSVDNASVSSRDYFRAMEGQHSIVSLCKYQQQHRRQCSSDVEHVMIL